LTHDTLRSNDDDDPEHGSRAAAFAGELAADGTIVLSPTQLETLQRACVEHSNGTTTSDPTIGCCWDADRLDLTRLGREVDPELLSTVAARAAIRGPSRAADRGDVIRQAPERTATEPIA
jgi:uncharacterized protein